MSPYEKDLWDHFQERLMSHLEKPKVKSKLIRTKKVDQEIRKFAKRYDKKYFTTFFKTLAAEK